MPPKPKEKRRRTHTLGGCGTCRRRHVKCDQVRPECLTCTAVGIRCEGYTADVKWMPNSKDKNAKTEKSTSTRRHLYSETSRASMSSNLTANLGSNSVDASLDEIDSRAKDTKHSSNIAVGPFSVLSFEPPRQATFAQPLSQPIQPGLTVNVNDHQLDSQVPTIPIIDTPSTIDAFMQLDDSLQWADIFELDFDNLVPQTPFGFGTTDLGFDGVEPIQQDIVLPDLSTVAQDGHEQGVLSEAQSLLRHFQDHVITAMGPVPYNTKSPWKIMNLSQAIHTLADLTFLGGNNVSHASIANMYGILACSSWHLARNQGETLHMSKNHWRETASEAGRKAKQHLQQSLQTEFDGAKKAKYKEQVMAVLSTMGYAIMSGSQKEARSYMLDTERLLRVRGLAKREISRRVRLLHHIYTWTRIVGESTYVLHDYKGLAPVLEKLNNHSGKRRVDTGQKTRLDDFLRLEAQVESDMELDEQQKDPQVGLHDIHLEDSREYDATMYVQIYGIPEKWLSLLSHTTRLANVIETLKANKAKGTPAIHESLQKRASRLENMLCSFAAKVASDETPPKPQHYMLRALNSALVILFYRRIREVNSWILQSHVDDVIQALQDFDQALQKLDLTGPGSAWPAFIAGCEAVTPSKREKLLRWIDNAHTVSGLQGHVTAREVLQELWKRKDEATTPNSAGSASKLGSSQSKVTWLDICREKNTWAMLC